MAQEPLPLSMDRAQLRESVIESQRKRVAGRVETYADIERVVHEDDPIVAEAALQPSVQAPLQMLARDLGVSLEEARRRWISVEEADLLLESGGDPEDVSSAHAVGVAQWILETGRRAGLKVNLPESNRLTALIDPLKRQAAWYEYLQQPDADAHAPGAPPITNEEAAVRLTALRPQLELLRAKRRKVDQRYDPRPAIFAHTRYLLNLYPRFPSLDWVMQAFHGGEAGVERTLKKYLATDGRRRTVDDRESAAGRQRWHGPASAIRDGGRSSGGGRLTFEDLYFGTTPRDRPACFKYLYGRLDDHRYYWWKVCAARRAIAQYRSDPAGFRRQWESLLPGRAKEALWYPAGPDLAIRNPESVRAAAHEGVLAAVNPQPGLKLADVPALLRPESVGLFRQVLKTYESAGVKAPLVLARTTVPESAISAYRPAPLIAPFSVPPPDTDPAHPIGGGPPRDFDYHSTGLVFDLKPPADSIQRRTLEYALGYLSDREILWWYEPHDHPFPCFHVAPNPRYREALKTLTLVPSPKNRRGGPD